MVESETAVQARPDPWTKEGYEEIRERAAAGDTTIMPEIRELLARQTSGGVACSKFYGDLYINARFSLAKPFIGDDLLKQTAVDQEMDSLVNELAGPNPSSLERILCERIALARYDCLNCERVFSQPLKGMSTAQALFFEAKRDRAHKRFLSACKALADVRKLLGPGVQIAVVQSVQVGT
jgi:hypothetical protein